MVAIIYKIENIQTGRVYVGCTTKKIRSRWNEHVHALRHNKHHCEELQDDFNVSSEDNFSMSCLETCTAVNKFERESIWIKMNGGLDSELNYNEAFSTDFRNKVSASLMGNTNGKGCIFTEELKRKIGEGNRKALTGLKHTEAHKKAQSEGNKRNWLKRKGLL